MKKLLTLAILCALVGCDSKPSIKVIDLETPAPVPTPAPPSAAVSTETVPSVVPQATPSQPAAPRRTAEGEFYLRERVTKVTDAGIVAFAAGKKVKFIRAEGDLIMVSDGKDEIGVDGAKLTRDIDLGEAIQARVLEASNVRVSAIESRGRTSSQEVDAARTNAAEAHQDSINATKIRNLETKVQAANRAVSQLEAEYNKSTKSFRQDSNGRWYRASDGGRGTSPDSLENRTRKDRIAQLQANMSTWKVEIQRIQNDQ